MANNYVNRLISLNKMANDEIEALEIVCANTVVNDEKSKAYFGNACILLSAMRRVDEATEAMLNNESVLKDDKGEFYQKIEETPVKTSENEQDKKDK